MAPRLLEVKGVMPPSKESAKELLMLTACLHVISEVVLRLAACWDIMGLTIRVHHSMSSFSGVRLT